MINVNDFIPELFLKLTSKTYPHGSEDICLEEMVHLGYLPKDISKDTHGNYFYKIGESRTIFASHLDTVSSKHEPVTHVIDGEIIRTDGTTTLGADDKAGVSVMVWMMKHNIPGTYYFFIGEEVGCIGSGLAAKYDEFQGLYDRIISFDRRGTNSIITHQSWSRCCSNEFADAFCAELNKSDFKLNYIKDDGGVYTDSAEFVDLIPECTNVSVGYYLEHSKNENQDIRHLVNLCSACLLVDWENLPTKRDTSVYEGKSYKTYSTSTYTSEWDNYGTKTSNSGKSWSRTGKSKDVNYYEDWYDNSDDIMIQNGGKKSKKVNKKKGKTYFDNGGNLVEISSTNDKQYDWILTKYSGSKLKEKELEVIKEQYLDIENNDYDRFFYECLVEEMLD
jgi:hypothetical protein